MFFDDDDNAQADVFESNELATTKVTVRELSLSKLTTPIPAMQRISSFVSLVDPVTPLVTTSANEWDVLEPWGQNEDTDTPQPSKFDTPLAYMSKTLSEATEDFYQMIDTRVSAVLTKSTSVVEYLKSKYLPVFVPHNWNGITGIPPLGYSWHSDK